MQFLNHAKNLTAAARTPSVAIPNTKYRTSVFQYEVRGSGVGFNSASTDSAKRGVNLKHHFSAPPSEASWRVYPGKVVIQISVGLCAACMAALTQAFRLCAAPCLEIGIPRRNPQKFCHLGSTPKPSRGVPPRDVATNLGISVPTLYRWIPASTFP
jgi:hypothetical protein